MKRYFAYNMKKREKREKTWKNLKKCLLIAKRFLIWLAP